ncbi:MAG: SWIM zinc finger family protein [Kouleothrix sp.]
MRAIPNLDEAMVRNHAAPESFSRGANYYRSGAVGDLLLRGSMLQADVEGSQYPSYRVRITLDQGGVTAASCSCPYDWGGWCKHIVAVLLRCIHEPERIAERPALEAQLAELDTAQLRGLLLGLAAADPDAADAIDRQVALIKLAGHAPAAPAGAAARAPERRSPIDQEAIRQQVRLLMRPARRSRYDSYDYDDDDPGGEVIEALRPLLEQAQRFVVGGDARSGLAALEALTTAYFESGGALFEQLIEIFGALEGAAGEFFSELALAWAEAVLSADLTSDERDEWGERLAGWSDQADELGAGQVFDLAVTAADQGWDYPPLQRVLAGEIGEQGAWDGVSPEYADELAQVRLSVLERQGRYQEYLYLAEAEGQIERYVLMLAKLGQSQRALEEGMTYLSAPNELLEVAKVLRERGALDAALQLAEHGLALPATSEGEGPYAYSNEYLKAPLANWTVDLATGMGQRDRALRAAETVMRIAPSLNAYLSMQGLAGAAWASLKPTVLDQLRRSSATSAKVDVFLHEDLIDDAITAVENTHDYTLLERVIATAIGSRPDWAISAATAQAERIMRAAKADRYEYAVNWLRHARDGYIATGRADEWRAYIHEIRITHGRKYKLMGLLERL